LFKGYRYIDRDAGRGWDRELKEPIYESHRCNCGGDENGQEWARVMSRQVVSLGRATVKDAFNSRKPIHQTPAIPCSPAFFVEINENMAAIPNVGEVQYSVVAPDR
jgi:hypothetical protein